MLKILQSVHWSKSLANQSADQLNQGLVRWRAKLQTESSPQLGKRSSVKVYEPTLSSVLYSRRFHFEILVRERIISSQIDDPGGFAR